MWTMWRIENPSSNMNKIQRAGATFGENEEGAFGVMLASTSKTKRSDLKQTCRNGQGMKSGMVAC